MSWNTPNVNLYYSCPAKSTKYFESEGVIEHFRAYFEENKGAPWAYVLDCEGYTLLHATQIHTSLALVNMVKNNYIKSLKKVWIIHYSFAFRIVMNAIMAILPPEIRGMIELSDKTLDEIRNETFLFP
jgi:hypothetical protein